VLGLGKVIVCCSKYIIERRTMIFGTKRGRLWRDGKISKEGWDDAE